MKFRIPGLILLLSLSLLFSLSSCEQPVLFNFGFASPVSPGDTVTSDTSESSESSDSPDTSESPDTVPDSEPESLPDTDTAPAAETEKTDFGVYFREKIAPVLLTVSTGAAFSDPKGSDFNSMYARANRALHIAKGRGKAQLCLEEEARQ